MFLHKQIDKPISLSCVIELYQLYFNVSLKRNGEITMVNADWKEELTEIWLILISHRCYYLLAERKL